MTITTKTRLKPGEELPTRQATANAVDVLETADGFITTSLALEQGKLNVKGDTLTIAGHRKIAHSEVATSVPIEHNGAKWYMAENANRVVLRSQAWVDAKLATKQNKRWTNLLAACKKGLADKSAMGITAAQLENWILAVEGCEYLFKLHNGAGVKFCKVDDRDATEFADVPKNLQPKFESLCKLKAAPVDLEAEIAKQTRVKLKFDRHVELGFVPEGFDDKESVEMARDAIAERLRKLEAQLKAQQTRAKKAADKGKAEKAATDTPDNNTSSLLKRLVASSPFKGGGVMAQM
jgi:hypothetical protein